MILGCAFLSPFQLGSRQWNLSGYTGPMSFGALPLYSVNVNIQILLISVSKTLLCGLKLEMV